jgi:hypothetical protein
MAVVLIEVCYGRHQGLPDFSDTIYQPKLGENTKWLQNYSMALNVPHGHKLPMYIYHHFPFKNWD